MVRFEPMPEQNGEVLEAVMKEIESLVSDEGKLFKLRLSTEEILENICNYSTSPFVQVTSVVEDGVITVCFEDSGVHFNPLERPDPDINAPLEERNIGGLGIFICKQMMDELSYKYANGCNTFTIKLKLN